MSTNPSRTLPSLASPFGPSVDRPAGAGPAAASAADAEPPVARAVPRTTTIHGEIRTDEYFWLRNREDPEVLAYLEAENRYTESVMATDGGAAGAAVRRDARADQGDGPLGAGADRRLALLPPHRGRRPVSDLLPPPGGSAETDAAAEEVLLDLNPLAERARLLPARRVRGQSRPPAAGLRGGHQRRGVVHAVRQGAGDRRRCWRRPCSTSRPAWRGPTTAAPCSTSCSTRPAVPAASTATGWATTPPRTRWCTSRPTSRSSSTWRAPGAGPSCCSSSPATRRPRSASPAPTGRTSRSAPSSRAAPASSTR